MRNKTVDAAEAVAIIRSGDTVASSGFVGVGTPDEIIKALERRFVQTGEPRDLSLVFAAAPGDGADRGLNRLAHPGLIKRLVGGHFGLVPKLARMAVDNHVEAYNLPLGCVSHLFREIAGRKAGLLSKVGLGTFVDPTNGGGKLNERTTEELVRLLEIDGEQWLFYKAFPIDVAIIRGTTADRNGNISMEKEALTLANLALATAAKNCNDFVTVAAEPGIVRGMPQGGLDFGAAINAESIIDQNQMFDFYDGGGLDLACLGMAQVDGRGDVNVSLFNGRLAGAGGFINISQNARELIFAGTFTTGGLKTTIVDGELKILSEGKSSKFTDKVDQITFSGRLAASNGQPVLYVTERCVFKLTSEGLELIEVAPGIDVERDILALMRFLAVVRSPKAMDTSLFNEALMQLDDRLLNRPLSERFMFDEKRNTLFLGLDGYRVHKSVDVEAIREGVFAIFARTGHRVSAVINYDSSDIAPDMADEWFSMAADVERTCY